MSNNLTTVNLTGLGALRTVGQEQIAKDFAAAVGKGVPRITFGGSRFHLKDATGTKRTLEVLRLDVIIIKVRGSDNRAYWDKAFSADDAVGLPNCSSSDGVKPTGPVEGRPVIQIANTNETRPVRSCAECPKNQPGSANDNTTRKACHWHKRAVVYLSDDLGGQPYLLQLGAMSYSDKLGANAANAPRGFKNYAQFLMSHNLLPSSVVTRITFEPGATVPVVRFSIATDENGNAIGLSEDGQRKVVELYGSKDVNSLLDAEEAADVETPSADASVTPPTATAAPVEKAENGRPLLGANAELQSELEKLKIVDPEAYEEGKDWALHPGTDVTEALEWVKEAIAAVAPPLPAPPPAPAAPSKPTRPPSRKSKSTEAAPAPAVTTTPPAPAAGPSDDSSDVSKLLGLDNDDL